MAYWPLDRLRPYARNARTHSPAQVATIAGSIQAFGFANPILVAEDGTVIAGHGRLEAARSLGLTEVPVIVLAGLDDAQRRRLTLADNRIAMNAGWDAEALASELADLAAMGSDLQGLGFTKAELATALAGGTAGGLVDEDAVPEGGDGKGDGRAVSRPGDLWQLGPHRLICGDSTDGALVARLLGEVAVRPNLMVTDPPYGVSYDPTWRHKLGVSASARTGTVANDDRADWAAAWALFPGDVAYVWHGGLHAGTVADSLTRTRFAIRAQIVWAKPRLVIGRGDYHWRHEPCWYAVRQGRTASWCGDRKQTTLWEIGGKDQGEGLGGEAGGAVGEASAAATTPPALEAAAGMPSTVAPAVLPDPNAPTIHGTQKPVACMRRPMLNHTRQGDAVFEPFLGSGTTLIAAETVGRVCLAVELDPAYVDLALRRWQRFTGKAVTLAGTGETFEAVARRRRGEAEDEDSGAGPAKGLAAASGGGDGAGGAPAAPEVVLAVGGPRSAFAMRDDADALEVPGTPAPPRAA